MPILCEFTLLLGAFGHEYSVANVVAAHDATVELVRTLDIDVTISGQRTKDHTDRRFQDHWRIRRDVQRERIQVWMNDLAHPDPKDQALNDIFRDGQTSHEIRNLIPALAGRLTPNNQQRASFSKRPQTNAIQGVDVYGWLGLTIMLNRTRERLTYREFASRASNVRVLPNLSPEGWVTLAGSLPFGENPKLIADFTIQLDPQCGMLARTIRSREPYFHSVSRESGSTTLERRFPSVTSFGDGVFFPTSKCEMLLWENDPTGDPVSRTDLKFTSLRVNERLPSDAFDFRFPANALVSCEPPKDGIYLELWGPNNAPIRGFATVGELESFRKLVASARPDGWTVMQIAMLTAILSLVAGVLMWRFRSLLRAFR
jgi:hypothetical protein